MNKTIEEKRTRAAEEIRADILKYFEENKTVFNDCIEELDAYNGCLGDGRYYSMDELNELFYDVEPMKILYRAFYGHDADTWTTDLAGGKKYDEFNPNREYFTFNGYGNLVSTDYKDYSEYLDDYIIENMSDNRYYVDTIDNNAELSILFDELENGGEENE